MQVNIEKRHLYFLAGLISILGIFTVFAAVDQTIAYHPLQQISTDGGTTSVDADSDGVIDNAESAVTAGIAGKLEMSGVEFTAADFCTIDGLNCDLGSDGGSGSSGGSVWGTLADNVIYYTAGGVNIGKSLTVEQSIVTRALFDRDDMTYFLDPNGGSKLFSLEAIGSVTAEAFVDKNDNNYYVDPASTSTLKTVSMEVINLNGDTHTALSVLRFGGFYSWSSPSCNVENPVTNACSCPTGYSSSDLGSNIFICWGTDDFPPINPPAGSSSEETTPLVLTWSSPGMVQSLTDCVTMNPDPSKIQVSGTCGKVSDTSYYYSSTDRSCPGGGLKYEKRVQICGYN
jgi:hypothetical protein